MSGAVSKPCQILGQGDMGSSWLQRHCHLPEFKSFCDHHDTT